MTLDEALAECPIVAILRGVRPIEVLAHVEALYDAGVRGIEVPLNSPEPFESIRLIVQAFGATMAVGAGTVLTIEQVDAVAAVGGRLIVAPNTSSLVIRRGLELGLEPAPGFATATEGFAALAAGARHLKLFPAATYGPGHLRQLKAVLPAMAVVWAVGGVDASNLGQWRAAGAGAFGIGGEIYRPGQTREDTARKAREIVAATQALG